jgi:hypothetical protein
VSSKVDALFAGEPPKKPVDVASRIRRIKTILWIAIPLDVLGIPCWTGVPGALLTLWAWLATDAEVARIEAGDYAHDDANRVLTLRRVAFWALLLSVVSLVVQTGLLSTPFYERLWAKWFPGIGLS